MVSHALTESTRPPQPISVRKRELELLLQSVAEHPKPSMRLEQYIIPAELAANLLFLACYVKGDIRGRDVADLGTGTGRLAIGALKLGASYVVGVDIDPTAIAVASKNSRLLGLKPDLVLGPIETLRGQFDTILMNPPFGTKKAHADIRFLQTAIKIGKIVYSIHKSSTRNFIMRWLKKHGRYAEAIIEAKMEIPHIFDFHSKRKKFVDVDVMRIESQ